MKRSFCFVTPRYWKGIAGGAETLIGNLAENLADAGEDITILTTCAKDNRTWKDAFPAGTTLERNLTIHRFSVETRDLDQWIPLQIRLHEGHRLTVEEQLVWMEQSVNSFALYDHILAFGLQYDALFFAPYLFGTTFWGSLIHPDRSFLVPCLHDEAYAYTDVIASMFRQVRGALFNAEAERSLAERLYGNILGGVVGMGFRPHADDYSQSLSPFFEDPFPYLLYLGRKESGKNVGSLIDFLIRIKEWDRRFSDLRLVIAGGGEFKDILRDEALKRSDIIDIAHVTEEEKHRLIQHSIALCQPSVNESFSIVLMEAWLLKIPVIVHGHCAVTREHVVRSGGGLYFSSDEDLYGVLSELQDSSQRRRMGEAGYQYVTEQYNWKAVLERFYAVVDHVLANPFSANDRI